MKKITKNTKQLLEELWKNGFRNCSNQVGGRSNLELEQERKRLLDEIFAVIGRAEDMGYGQGSRACENKEHGYATNKDAITIGQIKQIQALSVTCKDIGDWKVAMKQIAERFGITEAVILEINRGNYN